MQEAVSPVVSISFNKDVVSCDSLFGFVDFGPEEDKLICPTLK